MLKGLVRFKLTKSQVFYMKVKSKLKNKIQEV